MRLHRGSTIGDSRVSSRLSQLAADFRAYRGMRADHRERATHPSGISEIVWPLAARLAYASKPVAHADVPVSAVDLEPKVAVPFGGRFNAFDQQFAFVRCVGREDQVTTLEGKMRDIIH